MSAPQTPAPNLQPVNSGVPNLVAMPKATPTQSVLPNSVDTAFAVNSTVNLPTTTLSKASTPTPAVLPVSPPVNPPTLRSSSGEIPKSNQNTPAITKVHEEAQARIVKQAKLAYLKAQINRVFGRLHRHVAFFILCALFLYTNIWMFARAWQQEKAGENENWFHEGLFLVLMILTLIMFYYRLYRKSEIFQQAFAKREAAEKAAQEARLKLEEEQKKQAFMGLIKDFQSANTYEQKNVTMAKLLIVGLESNLLRQEAINLLCELNTWMENHKTFLSSQNLIIWRLKSSLFEQSERFQVDGATQDLSIKSINIIEAIVKKHLSDFMSGRTKNILDLSHKTMPTLTLTAQTIPIGSLKLDHANLWQANFAETKLEGLSFEGADLQAASFWRAELDNVNVKDANLNFSKLRTNLQKVLNLSAKQFFSTKEWELCYLSQAQQDLFFANPESLPPNAQSGWDNTEPRRQKLYFHLLKQQADALD